MDWADIIPPKDLARVMRKVRRFERLAQEIDLAYERGRFAGLEEKEEEAERLQEELAALFDLYMESPEEQDPGSLDELLIQTYLHPELFVDRSGWIENMRETIRMSVSPYDPDLHPSDKDVLAIAEEAVRRRRELISRYRKRPKLSGRPKRADCSYRCPAAGDVDFGAWSNLAETADQACRRELARRIDAVQAPSCEKLRSRWVD